MTQVLKLKRAYM